MILHKDGENWIVWRGVPISKETFDCVDMPDWDWVSLRSRGSCGGEGRRSIVQEDWQQERVAQQLWPLQRGYTSCLVGNEGEEGRLRKLSVLIGKVYSGIYARECGYLFSDGGTASPEFAFP